MQRPHDSEHSLPGGAARGVGFVELDAATRGAVYRLFTEVVAEGGAFPRDPPATPEMFAEVWDAPSTTTFAATFDGVVVGAYFLRPAFPGVAGHIANAGYMVDRRWRRRGIGQRLVEHSLASARERGFDAMLFSLVLESNPSGRLYERLGFTQIGRIPDAVHGETARIYWRQL